MADRDARDDRAIFNADLGETDPTSEQIPMSLPSLNKFILRAYNKFTKTLEVGGPSVARYLKGHKPYCSSSTGKITNLQTQWIVAYVLHFAQRSCPPEAEFQEEIQSREAFEEQYQNITPGQTSSTVYQDYEFRGPALRHLRLYEYCAQITIKQNPERPDSERQYYQFTEQHPLYSTHV